MTNTVFEKLHQAVSEAVARIKRAYREMTGAPAGWTVLTVVVPTNSEAHKDIIEIAERARAEIGRG